METNELLQQILAKLGNLEAGQRNLEDGQTAIVSRLDALELTVKQLDKRIAVNAEDTGKFFNMQTEYLTAEFKREITRIEIRIEHELFDKIEMLHEGYQMLREHLQIA